MPVHDQLTTAASVAPYALIAVGVLLIALNRTLGVRWASGLRSSREERRAVDLRDPQIRLYRAILAILGVAMIGVSVYNLVR